MIAAVPPNYADATVEKIAVNAVMAGCKPAYLPVVIAGVRAMCDERANLHRGAGHDPYRHAPVHCQRPDSPAARHQLRHRRVWARAGGRTPRSGRALRLIMVNIGGAQPGEIDKSAMGHPGKYTYCIGEYEEVSPWEPLHVEHGFERQQSTISVYCCDAPPVHQQPRQPDRPGYPEHDWSQHERRLGATRRICRPIIWSSSVLSTPKPSPPTAWTNGRSNAFCTRMSGDHCTSCCPARDGSEGLNPERLPGWLDATNTASLIPKVASPDNIIVAVAGGTAGRFSVHMCGWGGGAGSSQLVTVPIDDN